MTAHSEITGAPVLPAWAMSQGARKMTIREIAEDVSSRTGVPVRDIMGRRKLAGYARARWEVWSIARRLGMSYKQIGDAVGRDHTSILHGIRKAQAATLEAGKVAAAKARVAGPDEVEKTFEAISGYWSVCLGRHVQPEKVATMMALIEVAAREEAARRAEAQA